MKNFIRIIILLLTGINSYGQQPTVQIQNLQYTNNGQPAVYATNCGNIDLASSISTSLYLSINLSKPNGQVVGLSDLYVYTQKSSSDFRVERSWTQIQESYWNHPSSGNDTYLTSANFSINASDFNASGGTIFVIFKSNSGVEYTSCSYSITKTPPPSFSLSPSTISLLCGDTNQRTFTVTPANIPAGANVSYSWSHLGWTLVSSTNTSITIQPNSGIILPSNITVTPSINSVTQATKTCTITRAPFTSTATIIGASSLCTSSNYAINGLLSGETILWSVSNNSIASLSNITATSVTVNKIGNGTINLLATITNPCNQTAIVSKSINIGAPTFSSTNMSGDSNPLTGETKVYFVQAPTGYNSLEWYFDYGGTTGTSVNGWEILNGQGTTSITAKVGNPDSAEMFSVPTINFKLI